MLSNLWTYSLADRSGQDNVTVLKIDPPNYRSKDAEAIDGPAEQPNSSRFSQTKSLDNPITKPTPLLCEWAHLLYINKVRQRGS